MPEEVFSTCMSAGGGDSLAFPPSTADVNRSLYMPTRDILHSLTEPALTEFDAVRPCQIRSCPRYFLAIGRPQDLSSHPRREHDSVFDASCLGVSNALSSSTSGRLFKYRVCVLSEHPPSFTSAKLHTCRLAHACYSPYRQPRGTLCRSSYHLLAQPDDSSSICGLAWDTNLPQRSSLPAPTLRATSGCNILD